MQAPVDLVAFCDAQYPRLVGMLGLYCGDRALAEELAQETLLRMCRSWNSVRAKDDPAAWAARVGINLANSHYRRRRAEARSKKRLSDSSVSPEGVGSVAQIAIRDAVRKLPRRYRTALVLRYYLDLSFKDVATAMDVPLSTAKTLTRRAVAKLREVPGMTDIGGHADD